MNWQFKKQVNFRALLNIIAMIGLIGLYNNCTQAQFTSIGGDSQTKVDGVGTTGTGGNQPPTVDEVPPTDPGIQEEYACNTIDDNDDYDYDDDKDPNSTGDRCTPDDEDEKLARAAEATETTDLSSTGVSSKASTKGKNKKVLVCHIPPGNPDARHEICISVNAVGAHIDRHGDSAEHDYYGYCKDDDNEETTEK